MQRRAAGLVLVIITLISVMTVNAVAGRSLSGTAARLPVPAAPLSGSCLVLTAGAWSATDCSRPHTAEVVQGWTATASSGSTRYQRCTAAGRAYLGDQVGDSGNGSGQGGWSVPSVMTSTVLVSGPGPVLVMGWSWRACVVRPILLGDADAGYRGRLRDVPATGVLPAELRRCFNRPGEVIVVGVACSARHTGEILAARALRIFGTTKAQDAADTSPQVRAECLDIARRTTGAPDPTYGGRLEVVVDLHATGMGFVTTGKPGGDASRSYVLYQANCALQTAADGQLSASVVGLGSGPLPIR